MDGVQGALASLRQQSKSLSLSRLFLSPKVKAEDAPSAGHTSPPGGGGGDGHPSGQHLPGAPAPSQHPRLRLPTYAKALLLFLAGIHVARIMTPVRPRYGHADTSLHPRPHTGRDLQGIPVVGRSAQLPEPEEGEDSAEGGVPALSPADEEGAGGEEKEEGGTEEGVAGSAAAGKGRRRKKKKGKLRKASGNSTALEDGGAAKRNKTGLPRRRINIPEVDVPYSNFIILYRVLGNDLPLLHSVGQTRWNLEYILKHESDFEGCEKRWVLNRLTNDTEKLYILLSLKAHGYKKEQIMDIPLDIDSLAQRPTQASDADETKLPPSVSSVLPKRLQDPEVLGAYMLRSREYLGINQARNAAFAKAEAAGARWVWVLDGSHFVPDMTWQLLRNMAVKKRKSLKVKYIAVPGLRLTQPQDPSWLNASTSVEDLVLDGQAKLDESQIVLRNDSETQFNPAMVYPLGAKQALLDEVCSSKSKSCKCNDRVLWSKVTTTRKVRDRVVTCGASVRLWGYPPPGIPPGKLRRMKAKVAAVGSFNTALDELVKAKRTALQQRLRQSFAQVELSGATQSSSRRSKRKRGGRKEQ